MSILVQPSARPVDPIALRRSFDDIAISLTRSDAELTQAYRNGNRVGQGWDTWFERTARDMQRARDGYVLLLGHDDVAQRLGEDVLDLAESGGQLGANYRAGNTFGAGWDTTLDGKIADARVAADRLARLQLPPRP